MLRTVAQCEAAIADCESRLSALKGHLIDVTARAESPKREKLVQLATNAVGILTRELESLQRALHEARVGEGR